MSSLPSVYFFNPTCEYAIANGSPNWQANQLLQSMEADLSVLPMYFATGSDIVLVHQLPPNEFFDEISQLLPELPKFVLKTEVNTNPTFTHPPKNELRPWGWSPAVHKFLEPLKPSCSAHFKRSPIANWHEKQRNLYARAFALNILKQIQQKKIADFILPEHLTPLVCTTQNDFEVAHSKWEQIMVKAPWSSSGRGLQPVTKTPVHAKVWEKLLGIVSEQGYAIAEPLLKKVADLALQFEISNREVRFLGISNFYTNNKGQYIGNWLNGLPENADKKLVEFMFTAIETIKPALIKTIENSELATYYEGVFGVDMLIYSNSDNSFGINPCLEINLRHTMGLLALQLEKLLYRDVQATFRIYYEQGKTFADFNADMMKTHPLKISENKILSGFLALTPATATSKFGAYLLAEQTF